MGEFNRGVTPSLLTDEREHAGMRVEEGVEGRGGEGKRERK